MSNMFFGCSSLTTVPALDFSAGSSLTGIFQNCTQLSSIQASGFKVSFSVAGTALDAAALNTLFGNLATVTGQTITITGTPGAATCDQSIASAKGWTVTN